MRLATSPRTAPVLAALTSAALLLGALFFQYVRDLPPCEMCIWQRWPHGAAIVLGVTSAAFWKGNETAARLLAMLAIGALAISGAIGVFHAGVEWDFWEGPACSGAGYVPGSEDITGSLQIVRCDVAAWRLFGISLAGYNALISFGVAAFCARLLQRAL